MNMDRRLDRWEGFQQVATAHGIPPHEYTRETAIDGRTIDLFSPEIRSLFNLSDGDERSGRVAKNPYADHGYQPAVIGNALTHFGAYRKRRTEEQTRCVV